MTPANPPATTVKTAKAAITNPRTPPMIKPAINANPIKPRRLNAPAITNPSNALIGLTGEIRRVSAIEQRVKEVQKLGFEKVYIPKNNLSGWKAPADIEVVGIATLDEALKRIFR